MSDFEENRHNFHADPSRNPETNRRIKIGGGTYQMLVQKYGAPGEEAPRAAPKYSAAAVAKRAPRAPKSTAAKGPVLIRDILCFIISPLKDYHLLRAFAGISPAHKRVAHSCVTVITGDVIPAKFAMSFPRIQRIEGILGVESEEEASRAARWIVERSLPRLRMIYRSGAEVFPPSIVGIRRWGLNEALAIALKSLPHQDLRQTIPDYVVIAENAAYDRNRAIKMAARSGDAGAVDFFIKRGADDQRAWHEGLMGAARGGHRGLVDFFIEKGAGDWDSGLAEAAGGGHRTLVDFFIEKGATNLKLALNSAVKGGHVGLFKFLRDKLRAEHAGLVDADYWFALLATAVREGHRGIVDLLEKEPSIKNNITIKKYLVSNAIISNDPVLVKRYIQDRMDPVSLPEEIMGQLGNMDIIQLVVEKIIPHVELDMTALAAAGVGRLNVIEFLDKAGRLSPKGLALAAARGGYEKLYHRALARGPRDMSGVLEKAAKRGNISVVNDLPAWPTEVFMGAVMEGRLDLAREYIPTAIAEIERTSDLMQETIERGDREMMSLLETEIEHDYGSWEAAVEAGDLFFISHVMSQGKQRPNSGWIHSLWKRVDRKVFDFFIDNVENIHSLIIAAINLMWVDDLVIAMIKRANWSEDFIQRARAVNRPLLVEKIEMLRPAQ